MGRLLALRLYYESWDFTFPALPMRDVLVEAAAMLSSDDTARELTLSEALTLVSSQISALVASKDLSFGSADKLLTEMGSLATYFQDGLGVTRAVDVTADDLDRWIHAPIGRQRRKGQPPSASTRSARRSAARALFRSLRHLGFQVGDPTTDIRIVARAGIDVRALRDDELGLLELVCYHEPPSSHLRAVLALTASGLMPAEAAEITISMVNLEAGSLQAPGSTNRFARTVYLSAWAKAALEKRIEYLVAEGAADSAHVVYGGAKAEGRNPSAAVGMALTTLMTRAGLHREPGVLPRSIAANYAVRIWEHTADLPLVARAMGMRDLNRVADLLSLPHANVGPGDDDTKRIRASLGAKVPAAAAHPQGPVG
ncbi:MAG: hypothetical protein WCP28_10920 [Actinomycetes bacterium]